MKKNSSMDYDSYNREERYLCAHLFRLMHHWLADDNHSGRLREFLERSGAEFRPSDTSAIKIYYEVALIRDAYHAHKDDASGFMGLLAREVARQEQLNDVRPFGDLPAALRDPKQTHPRQILYKAESEGIQLSGEEAILYGAIQGMFNAKPDLAITSSDAIIAYEAKFTEPSDQEQSTRTKKIAKVWGGVLFRDLGFEREPHVLMATIGPQRAEPNVSWEWICDQAADTYPPADRTRIALKNAVRLLA